SGGARSRRRAASGYGRRRESARSCGLFTGWVLGFKSWDSSSLVPGAEPGVSLRPCLPQPESRVEAELALGLLARHRAIVLGDVVDAPPLGHRQQGSVGGGIDVQRALPLRPRVPGARTVEAAVAQHDALDAGHAERLLFQ